MHLAADLSVAAVVVVVAAAAVFLFSAAQPFPSSVGRFCLCSPNTVAEQTETTTNELPNEKTNNIRSDTNQAVQSQVQARWI